MIREARSSDKAHVLKFCKNTFSWGDYIEDIWNFWLSEGSLLVAEIKIPVGLCHAVFFNHQVWIEGIRIDPDFRRKGIASKLVRKIEFIAKHKQISASLMLIDTANKTSLLMAKNLNYQIYQTWNFYSLSPKQTADYNISFGNIIDEIRFSHYVKSWRWIPLDQSQLNFLNSHNCIVQSGEGVNKTIAILETSEHFKNTMIVTLSSGSQKNTKNVISFLQNYGYEKKYRRLQILTRDVLPDFGDLDLKNSFHLMQKLLS